MGKCSVCYKEFENEYFDLEQNKCILHCEKDTWFTLNENNEKVWDEGKVNLFWKLIHIELDEIYQNSLLDDDYWYINHQYENIIFPRFEKDLEKDPYVFDDDYLGTNFYSFCKFEQRDASIEDALNTYFEKLNIEFNNCKFLDIANFEKYNFEKDIVFYNCAFKDELLLNRLYKKRVSFLNCPEIKSLDFSKIVFEQKVEIKECVITSSNFENTRFKKVCDFYKTKFHCNNFTKTTFEDIAVFTESKFYKDVNFKYTTFEKLALFRKTIFEKKVNFEDSIFKEEANFLETTSKEDKIEDIDVANRETARIIKNSFEQQNNIIEANKFYALEMKEREKELTKDIENKEKRDLKTFIDYIIFKIHGISSNHSQDAFLAFYWIIVFGITASLYEIYLLCTCSFSIINMITVNLFISAPIIINRVIEANIDRYTKYYLFVLYLLNYFFIVINCSPIKLENTVSFAKTINPFSIMKGTDDIDIVQLFFKITIAYLIYQFIVSVRQNTRRK